MWSVRRPGAGRRLDRAVTALDGQPADRPWDAAHQRRGGRVQLRDVGTGPAQPHLRPGCCAGWCAASTPGQRRRDGGDPGRDSPDPVSRRRGDRRRKRRSHRYRRDHGRSVDRNQWVNNQRGPRDGLVGPNIHHPVGSTPWPAQRGVGPLRAGCRPRGGRPGHAPLRRTSSRVGSHPGSRHGGRAGQHANPGDNPGADRPGQQPSGDGVRTRRGGRAAGVHRVLHPAGRRRPGRGHPELPTGQRHRDRRSGRGGPYPRLPPDYPDCPPVDPHRIPNPVPGRPAGRAVSHGGHGSRRGHAGALPGPGRPGTGRPGARRDHGVQPASGRGISHAGLATPRNPQNTGLQRLAPTAQPGGIRGRPRLPASRRRPAAT